MSAFDFGRFNGFARQGLDSLLFSDLWNHGIFNERDMHSAAYYYIREYFAKRSPSRICVRCEPQIAGMKADIVVFDSGRPVYAIEFKLFTEPNPVNEELIWKDLNKLADVINTFDSMRWGFFHLIYDSDESFKVSDASLRRRDYKKVSVTTINARRREETERRRVGYDEWRREFDRLRDLHRQHSYLRTMLPPMLLCALLGPSSYPTCYGWLRQPSPVGEIQR